MKRICITDVTLQRGSESYSFREKIEIAKLLARIGVDTIAVAPLNNRKSDILFLHTIAPMLGESTVCCPVEWSEESIESTWEALRVAPRARMQIGVFTSPVGMEYHAHKKPKKILEELPIVVACCKRLCAEVEFRAEDATRAETQFLDTAIRAAIEAGATVVTVCDTAGMLLPQEMHTFVSELRARVPELGSCRLAVECSEQLQMGTACAAAALVAGADEVVVEAVGEKLPSLTALSFLLHQKGAAMELSTVLDQTAVAHVAEEIRSMRATHESGSVLRTVPRSEEHSFTLSGEDDRMTVAEYIRKLGYTLSDEDLTAVYDAFRRLAVRKPIGEKELEAIVATSAMQVAPTYVIKSYLANSGNTISSTAHIVLEKDGAECHGISVGDGPIDAAFRAIEQVTGHHFELDDFQIRAITEGREAVGEAVVKLRADGRLYSGCGVSTDIIGASVHAYINALNKICHEEVQA